MEDFYRLLAFSSFGLLLAILFYFNKDIEKILQEFRKKTRTTRRRKSKLLIYIIITCVVGALAGYSSTELINRIDILNNVFSLAIIIGLTGIIMIIVDNVIKKDKLKDESKINAPHAIIIGSSELLASLPGVFHPAATIIAGRLVGLNNKSAARYSFITFIPFVCGIFIKALFSTGGFNYFTDNLIALLISNIITLAVGYLIITLIFRIFKKSQTLQWFGYSRVVVSLIIAIVALLS